MHQSLTVPMRVRYLGGVLLATALGCGGSHTTTSVVAAPDGSYEVLVPARWAGAYRIDSLSTQERGTARPGALNLVFLPADTTVRPQTLVVVAVYDSTAWAPPRVYVVGLPQSNPFAPGSKDAVRFDSLELRPAEVMTLVRVR